MNIYAAYPNLKFLIRNAARQLYADGLPDEANAALTLLEELEKRPATIEVVHPNSHESIREASRRSYVERSPTPQLVIKADGWETRMQAIAVAGAWGVIAEEPVKA